MKRNSLKLFLSSILCFSLFLPLSCAIQDKFAEGSILIKLPGKPKISREAESYENFISYYKVELYEVILQEGEIKISDVPVATVKGNPGATIRMTVKNEGNYTLSMSACQNADNKEYYIGEGHIQPESPTSGYMNYFTVKKGEPTKVTVEFEDISPVSYHKISEDQPGSYYNPISEITILKNVIASINTKELPTGIYVDNITPPTSEQINITNNVTIMPVNEDSIISSVYFKIENMGNLSIGCPENPITVELNNTENDLFYVSEKSSLNIKNATLKNTTTPENTSYSAIHANKGNISVTSTNFEGFKYDVIKIEPIAQDDRSKFKPIYKFNDIIFSNCSTKNSVYNINTSYDINLDGDNNIIQSIYLNNEISSVYEGWSSVGRILISETFATKHDEDSSSYINPTLLYVKDLREKRAFFNQGLLIKSQLFFPEIVLYEAGTPITDPNMGINKLFSISDCDEKMELSYNGIPLCDGSLLIKNLENSAIGELLRIAAVYSTTNNVFNIVKNRNTNPNFYDFTTATGTQITITNTNYYQNPFVIYSSYKAKSEFRYSVLPVLDVEKTNCSGDYDFIIDGTDKYTDITSGIISEENPIVFLPHESVVNNTLEDDPYNPACVISLPFEESRVLLKNIDINHAVKRNNAGVQGIYINSDNVVLENVNLTGRLDSNNKLIGGSDIHINGNSYQQVIKLKGDTSLETISIEPASADIIIDITEWNNAYNDSLFTLDVINFKRNGQIRIAGCNADNMNHINISNSDLYIDNTGAIYKR